MEGRNKENLTLTEINNFFNSADTTKVIKPECLFTKFIIEHSLPLSCSDHVGPLLRKIFPNNDIVKNYGCARTQTTAIINAFAHDGWSSLLAALKREPFSISTDGSNDTDKKLSNSSNVFL